MSKHYCLEPTLGGRWDARCLLCNFISPAWFFKKNARNRIKLHLHVEHKEVS